jgi:hypothetical protein
MRYGLNLIKRDVVSISTIDLLSHGIMSKCRAGRTAAADDGADVSDAAAQSSGINSYESPL